MLPHVWLVVRFHFCPVEQRSSLLWRAVKAILTTGRMRGAVSSDPDEKDNRETGKLVFRRRQFDLRER